jgi:hypothetical protein
LVVYSHFICHHSPFFKEAFNSSLIGGLTKTMTLNNSTPSAFSLFVN